MSPLETHNAVSLILVSVLSWFQVGQFLCIVQDKFSFIFHPCQNPLWHFNWSFFTSTIVRSLELNMLQIQAPSSLMFLEKYYRPTLQKNMRLFSYLVKFCLNFYYQDKQLNPLFFVHIFMWILLKDHGKCKKGTPVLEGCTHHFKQESDIGRM